MFFSRTGMHALRAVIFIARQEDGVPVGASEIARSLDLPANYLSKTLRQLAQRGVLKSTRGRAGGFALARPATEIVLADVVAGSTGSGLGNICLLGGTCRPEEPCVAHARWSRWEREMSGLLEDTRISEFLTSPAPDAGQVDPAGTKEILHLGADR